MRTYNEDKLCLISKTKHNLGYFAIYDGHGGQEIAELVKENLFFYILKDKDFEENVEKAIINGCRLMD